MQLMKLLLICEIKRKIIMDKIVGKIKKQIEKTKIKRYFKKLIDILSLKELRILPAYLAYSFV